MSRDHRAYVRSLPLEERQLLILRSELYGGSWIEMKQDLKDRLAGKPFIYKLINRIEEDLKRIERLEEYERTHAVNLTEFVQEA